MDQDFLQKSAVFMIRTQEILSVQVLEAVASDREVVVGRLASLSCGLADLGDLSPKSL